MEFPPDPLSPRPSYARIAMRRGETRRDLKTEGGEQPDRQTSDAGSEVDIRVCSSAESRLSAVFCPSSRPACWTYMYLNKRRGNRSRKEERPPQYKTARSLRERR